jgi:hypothetical protein
VSGAGAFYQFGTSVADDHVPFNDGNIYDGFGSTVRKTVGNVAPSMANWHLWNVTTAPGEYTARVNGLQVFTTATNTVAFHTACRLGRGVGSNSDGGMTCIWLFDNKLSTDDRRRMNLWLNFNQRLGLSF